MSEESPTLTQTPVMHAAWRKYGPCADAYSMTHILRVGEDLERRLAAVTAERDTLYQALCDLRAECIADGWLLSSAKIRVIDDATAALRVADKRAQEQLMHNAQAIMDAALRRP